MTLLLTLFFSWHCHAVVTAEQILRTAWEDKLYLSQNDLDLTGSANPFRSVEAFVGRESVSNKNRSEIETGLKFNLKSWPEWKSGQKRQDPRDFQKKTYLGLALRERYSAILSLKLNSEKIDALKEAIRLSDLQIKALGLSLKAGRATSKTFLSTQIENNKLRRGLALLSLEYERTQEQIRTWTPAWTSSDLTQIDLISVSDILRVIQKRDFTARSITERTYQNELLDLNYELAIAKGKKQQWLKSIQLGQSNDEKDQKFEFEITLQLPFMGSDDSASSKHNELILKRAAKEKELQANVSLIDRLKLQIVSQSEIYEISSGHSEFSKKISTPDPLSNIEAKLGHQQERIERLNQQHEITNLYLDYLFESEILIQNPDQNFLDKKSKAFL